MNARRAIRPPEGTSWVWRHRTVLMPILLTALPPEVPFGFVGRVLPTGDDAGLDVEIHPIPPPEALRLLEASESVARAELHRGETGESGRTAELTLEAESAAEFGREVAARRQGLHRVGLVVRAIGPSWASADRTRVRTVRRLRELGFRTRGTRYDAAAALAAPTFDGGPRRSAGYWHTLSTDGAAAFFPFIDESVLEPGGILVGILLDGGSPVVLDRYRHASHSWGLFGATGSGKSFAAALWALRSLWMVPELELYLLDPLGEFGRLAERLGGTHLRVGPEDPLAFDPLAPPNPGTDGATAAARLGVLVRALFPSLRDEESAALEAALGRRTDRSPEVPSFSELREELLSGSTDPGRLPTLLEIFRTGSLRHLDRPRAGPPPRLPVVYDLAGVPEGQRAFHLTYVLDGLYDRLRATDRPKLVVVDEAHLLLRTPGTAEFLDRLVRHVRHYRTGLLLISQGPDDFLQNEAGRSLLRNLRATLLLRTPSVSGEAQRFFDLTDAEAEWLPRARLPREAGYAEGLLRFGPAHLPIAVLASTPEFDLLRGAMGSPSAGPAGPPVERHV